MNFRPILLLVLVLMFNMSLSQNNDLPYYEIPDYPESFTACSVAARMIDGLGFRYYWATEGLREEDLTYRPNEDARATSETVDHIYDLSKVIVNASLKLPNTTGEDPEVTFEEKRKKTLENFKKASDILKKSDDLSQFTIVFQRGENTSEFPYWNNINGPIADAIWHCGQVVLLRRSSGNPFSSKVSVFSGKVRN